MPTLHLINVRLSNRSSTKTLHLGVSNRQIRNWPAYTPVIEENVPYLWESNFSVYRWFVDQDATVQGDFPPILCEIRNGATKDKLRLVRTDTGKEVTTITRGLVATDEVEDKPIEDKPKETLTLINEYIQNATGKEGNLYIHDPSGLQLIPKPPHWLRVHHTVIDRLMVGEVGTHSWSVVQGAATSNGACILESTDKPEEISLRKEDWTGQEITTFETHWHKG